MSRVDDVTVASKSHSAHLPRACSLQCTSITPSVLAIFPKSKSGTSAMRSVNLRWKRRRGLCRIVALGCARGSVIVAPPIGWFTCIERPCGKPVPDDSGRLPACVLIERSRCTPEPSRLSQRLGSTMPGRGAPHTRPANATDVVGPSALKLKVRRVRVRVRAFRQSRPNG